MRSYVNGCIQFKSNQQYNGNVIEPNQDDDDGCQTTVEFVVIGEVDEEVFQALNGGQCKYAGSNGTRRKEVPALLGGGSEKIEGTDDKKEGNDGYQGIDGVAEEAVKGFANHAWRISYHA